MGKIKNLLSQTFVYGLSSIIGRLLNYFLVPLYTNVFATNEYGIVIELYTYISFLMIILTYGMETGFFRFSKLENPDKVFSTALTSLFSTSSLFFILGWIFLNDISNVLGYSNHQDYILMFIAILSVDAFVSIPFARLRMQNKAFKFAIFKLINIVINIGLNLIFILLFPKIGLYNQDFGVGYILLANLIASISSLLLFLPDFFKTKFNFDKLILKKMLIYSLPLVISGLCGMINEFFDRVCMKFFYTIPPEVTDANAYVLSQLGIYGANAKIAILMTLFIQTFRYASDPFFFSESGNKDFNEVFAKVNKYLFAFGMFIFLFVMGYLDIFKHFINHRYWEALNVVPLLLIGHLLSGMIYLQSFWYKLINKTNYGIIIFAFGCIVTILINSLFIPKFGYMACAWANLICYLVMLIITFFWGKKYLPAKYDFSNILRYFLAALIAYVSYCFTGSLDSFILKITLNTCVLLLFVLIVYKYENLGEILIKIKQKVLAKFKH